MPLEVLLLILRIATVLALFAFLGALLLMLWRDVSAAASAASPEAEETGARLILLEPGTTPIKPGHAFKLRRFNVLGRAPTSTIVLADDFASIEHAHILLRGDHWWLEDQHSHNGTTLNNIRAEEPLVLSSGDLIGIGSVTLRFELEHTARR